MFPEVGTGKPPSLLPPFGLEGDKTHCKNGHEFTPANTITNPCEPTRRRCRICTNAAQRRADAVRRSRRVGHDG